MPNIRILADSSCDLTDEQLSRHGITIVPLTIIIGETQYTDRVDIDSDRFFELIRDGRLTPSTSQPNLSASNAAATPMISMRLLVVRRKPSDSSRRCVTPLESVHSSTAP